MKGYDEMRTCVKPVLHTHEPVVSNDMFLLGQPTHKYAFTVGNTRVPEAQATHVLADK